MTGKIFYKINDWFRDGREANDIMQGDQGLV